jgi:hypothetical protein
VADKKSDATSCGSYPGPGCSAPESAWWRMMEEAQSCRRKWGIGFPVISTFLLRKFWKEATGYLPPDTYSDPKRVVDGPHRYDGH